MPERVFAATPQAAARGGLLASPFQFFTTGEENLRIESVCSAPGVTLTAHYRFLDPAQGILVSSVEHNPNSDRTARRSNYALGAGALLNLTIVATVGAPRIGQCFVRVQLIRGLEAATLVMGTLLQGYVTAAQDLGWPGSPIRMSTEDAFPPRLIIGTDPAAGGECSETVPTGAIWEVLAYNAVLVTDATAVGRVPQLVYFDGANVVAVSHITSTVPGSVTRRIAWGQGLHPLTPTGIGITFTAPLLQNTFLLPGERIATATENLQPGDNYAAPVLLVREQMEVIT